MRLRVVHDVITESHLVALLLAAVLSAAAVWAVVRTVRALRRANHRIDAWLAASHNSRREDR